ncbi:hypothetical protein V8Z74_19425 [Comamonas sp. w2-DMI]|uniref:hypothetical protein n=1 Tax=Comamonas sp. w2-DMI TaxID=3126391 RepID=UPI0032E3F70E
MTQQTPNPASSVIDGTPVHVGAEIFHRFCLPAVQAACKNPDATLDQLVQLYAGHIQACFGAMAADFGHERAIEIAQLMVDTFKTVDFGCQAAKH